MPVGYLSNRHDKPGATGEDACTREDDSEGPSPARSGGTTDHAAERNDGSGQAGSVTERSDGASPCWTRTAWSGAGPGRTSPTTPRPGITQASRDSGEREDVPPHARGHGDRLHAGRHAGKITGPDPTSCLLRRAEVVASPGRLPPSSETHEPS